jgi:hypothetical protein
VLQTITSHHPLPRKGFAPHLSASEVITMEIVAEYQGIDTDTGIWGVAGSIALVLNRCNSKTWYPPSFSCTSRYPEVVIGGMNLCVAAPPPRTNSYLD